MSKESTQNQSTEETGNTAGKRTGVSRRKALRAAQMSAASLSIAGLAGCSGESNGDGGSGDGGGDDSSENSTTSQTEPAQIGVIVPLSGQFAETGSAYRAAYESWALWAEDQGLEFEIEYRDNESDVQRSSQIASQYASDEKDIVINAYSSSLTKASIPPLDEAEIPMLSTGSKNPSIHRPSDWAFAQMAPNSREGFAAMCAENGVTKVATLGVDLGWAKSEKTAFRDAIKNYDIEIVVDSVYPTETSNFASVFLEAKNQGAEAVVTHGYPSNAGSLLQGIIESGWEPSVASFLGLSSEDQYQSIGPDIVEGAMGERIWAPDFTYKGSKEIMEYWEQAPSRPEGRTVPTSDAAQAYAGMQTVGAAIEELGQDIHDSNAVREFWLNNPVETLAGMSEFAPDGTQIGITSSAIQWIDGKDEFVWPEEVATTDEFVFPKPW